MREMPSTRDDLDEFTNEEKAELDQFATWLMRNPVVLRWADETLQHYREREKRNGEAG